MKIGYSKTFPILGKDQWEKIWVENEIQGTLSQQDIKNELYSLKKTVENFHYESAGAEKKKEQEIPVMPQTPEQRIGLDVADIYSVEDLKVLEQSYKYLVKNKPVLQAAYDMQHKKLSEK